MTDSGSDLESAAAAETGPLPDDVAAWKKGDFFRARAENDPRLLKAVERLGIQFPGNEPVAKGLAELLESFDAEAALARNPHLTIRPRTFADNSRLVEAIVIALGDNGSASARNTLAHILDGTLSTDDNRIAVETALKMLIARPCRENDELVARAVVTPEAFRPSQREGAWPAAELQAKAIQLLKASDSDELRGAIAEHLGKRFSQLPASHPLAMLLTESDPVNCRAQRILYGMPGIVRDVKARFEQQLLDESSASLACLLGISNDVPGGVSPLASRDPYAERLKMGTDMSSRIAMQLWSDEFAAVLGSQLADLWSWERQAKLLLLAGTIPTDSVRASLLKQLRKHWTEGPKALETAGLPDVVTDPGLLVLLKILPHRPKLAAKTPRPAPTNKTQQLAQQKEQAEQDWMVTLAKMDAAWCKRLHAAALAKAKTAGAMGRKADVALPQDFELSPNARVTAAYHCSWPQESPISLGPNGMSFLDVYYVSLEENGKPKKVVAYYSRQAQTKVADARVAERAIAIDSLRFVQGDHRRSVDVVVARPDDDVNNTDMLRDESEANLIVKILIVEIKDPGKDSADRSPEN
jgi:hypothetical protein